MSKDNTFGKKTTKIKEVKGLTQEQLAELVCRSGTA